MFYQYLVLKKISHNIPRTNWMLKYRISTILYIFFFQLFSLCGMADWNARFVAEFWQLTLCLLAGTATWPGSRRRNTRMWSYTITSPTPTKKSPPHPPLCHHIDPPPAQRKRAENHPPYYIFQINQYVIFKQVCSALSFYHWISGCLKESQ